MSTFVRGISLLALLLLQQSVVVELLIIRRHYHDGILYEDFAADSDNIRYTITNGQGWDDLDSLVATHNLRGKSMFCTRGPGAWLLYQDANYQFGSMRQLKVVYGEHCVAADNVNSLQPLGAVYVKIDDVSAVVVFSEKYFQSKGTTSRVSVSQNIKSAIFVGTASWTVEADGKKTCIIVANMGDLCLLEDIQNSFSLTSDDLKIEKGCDNDTSTEQYHLQTCYSTGFHELTYDFDLSLPSIKQICAGTYDENDQAKDKFLNVVKIWKKRMNPPTQEHFPSSVPNAAQRLNTLYQMVDIMSKSCKSVDDDFLELVKYIYMLHIQNGLIWNVTDSPNATKIEQSHAKWSRAQTFIMNCANIKFDVTAGCEPAAITEMKNEKEIAVIEDFLTGESYDYVIEHIWLLLNYVSTYCNYHMGFKNNDWSIFPLMFKRDFLYPLQEQWKNPGKWSSYYTSMMNGYDMKKERKAMITCVQAIIKITPFYDPLARPPGFYTGNNTAERDAIGRATDDPTTANPRVRRQHLGSKEIPEAEGQISTTIKPTVSTIKPTVSTIKPTVSTIKPTVSTIKPTVSTVKHTVSTSTPTVKTIKPTVITTTATTDTSTLPNPLTATSAGTRKGSHHHHSGTKKKKKSKKSGASTIITVGTTTTTTPNPTTTPPILVETLMDGQSPITEIIIGAGTPEALSNSATDKPSDALENNKGTGKKDKKGKKKKHSGKHHKKGEKQPSKILKDNVSAMKEGQELPPPIQTGTNNKIKGNESSDHVVGS